MDESLPCNQMPRVWCWKTNHVFHQTLYRTNCFFPLSGVLLQRSLQRFWDCCSPILQEVALTGFLMKLYWGRIVDFTLFKRTSQIGCTWLVSYPRSKCCLRPKTCSSILKEVYWFQQCHCHRKDVEQSSSDVCSRTVRNFFRKDCSFVCKGSLSGAFSWQNMTCCVIFVSIRGIFTLRFRYLFLWQKFPSGCHCKRSFPLPLDE